MAQHSTLNWRAALWPLVLVAGLGTTVSAQAGREITSSDSGGGPGILAPAQGRLYNCDRSNFETPALQTGPFDCVGALAHGYNEASHFNVIEQLVDGRISQWTSTNESANVSFTNTTLFFGAGLQGQSGDFVLVFSGTWLSNPFGLNNAGRTGWSSYYLLEDVSIGLQPFHTLRYQFEGTDLPDAYTTRGLEVDAVSFYRISRVPEPDGLALVAVALAALVLLGRGRRR